MVSLIELTEAMTATLQKIPELVALLDGGAAAIKAYIDDNPEQNSLTTAEYQMPAGSLLVAWDTTTLNKGEMTAWDHRHRINIRPRRGESGFPIIDAIVDGTPIPGDGQRWRYCPLISGVLGTEVTDISRLTDEEGIDFFRIETSTFETGDIYG